MTAASVSSLPLQVGLSLPFIARGVTEVRDERRVGAGVLDASISVAMLGAGLFVGNALFFCLYFGSQELPSTTRDRSEHELVDILDAPQTVRCVRDGELHTVPFDQVRVGDVVDVAPGEVVPVDGWVIEGGGLVDQRALTGESQPIERAVGDTVLASSVLHAGRLRVRAERPGAASVAARIGEILIRTTRYETTVQSRGEAIVDRSAKPSLALAGVTLVAMGPMAGVTSMMAGFGYNMRVLAPLSVIKILRAALESGIVVKDGRALELLKDIDTVVFDKTGTLTAEQPSLGEVYPASGADRDEVLRLAATAEERQTHPLARAIREGAAARGLTPGAVDEATFHAGRGVEVTIDGRAVHVGSARLLDAFGIERPADLAARVDEGHARGFAMVWVAVDGRCVGVLELRPTVREEARQVVDALKARGLETRILSGDAQQPTAYVAAGLGIDHFDAEVLSEDKSAVVERLQAGGRSVCFVGDGINDALALRAAHVSVSLAGATTVATDTAQVVLMRDGIGALPYLFELSDDLEKRLERAFVTTVAPGVALLGGVFLLNWGVMTAMALFAAGLGAGVGAALAPLDAEPSDGSAAEADA